jgi:hypothetical protein
MDQYEKFDDDHIAKEKVDQVIMQFCIQEWSIGQSGHFSQNTASMMWLLPLHL